MTEAPWPTELRLADSGRTLAIAFDDGSTFRLDAEYLRVASPSAEVTGHTPAERKIVFGKRGVAIAAIEPIGNYAMRLVFDDRHDTGLYTFAYLHELGRDHAARWAAYLAELAEKGLRRDPHGVMRAPDDDKPGGR